MMMMVMILMIGTICPESTVRLFIAPAILGPPVQVFPLLIMIIIMTVMMIIIMIMIMIVLGPPVQVFPL